MVCIIFIFPADLTILPTSMHLHHNLSYLSEVIRQRRGPIAFFIALTDFPRAFEVSPNAGRLQSVAKRLAESVELTDLAFGQCLLADGVTFLFLCV